MAKLLKDIATVVRCKPLATGPSGIEVSVVGTASFSLGGLEKVRATIAKQVNAQKICVWDVIVRACREVTIAMPNDSFIGKVVDDRGVVLIRFASDTDTQTYAEFLKYAIRSSAGDRPLYDWRELFNAIGSGQIEMPDLTKPNAKKMVEQATRSKVDAEVAERAVREHLDVERASWEELLINTETSKG